MFDAHIQYYCYNNTKDDEFGVGYIGNKEFWTGLINRWNKNDKLNKGKITIEQWDELDCDTDFRGCQLAEVVPDEDGHQVIWPDVEGDNSIRINKKYEIIWENNPSERPSVPRWVTRLKNQLRENEN